MTEFTIEGHFESHEFMRAIPYAQYDPVTGEILQAGYMEFEGLLHFRRQGRPYVIGNYDWATHWVDPVAKGVRDKTACPAVLDGLALTQLPVPCRIEISNPIFVPSSYEVDEPEIDLDFEQPGTYKVRVLSVRHFPAEFTVTV